LAISKERKDGLVSQYKELIEDSRAIILTEYGGMSVKDIQNLRAKIREVDGQFLVTKNTLLMLALEETGRPNPDDLFTGQLATSFALGETPSLAKALVDYAKSNDNLKIVGGIMEQDVLTKSQVEALASLPSLEQLRAQLLGLFGTPARNIASTIASGVRQVVNVVDAYAKSGDAEPEVG